MKRSRLALVALLAVVPCSVVAGQSKPQTREGFTFAIGVGGGSVGIGCDFCGSERQSDASGFLRIGATVRPNLIIGGQLRGWTHEVDATTTATVGYLLADALFYPMPQKGWYLEVGLGLGQYRNSDDQSNAELTATGTALSVGTGYDFRIGKNFSLTPYVSSSGAVQGKIKQNGVSTGGKMDVGLNQIGLAFTWH